MTANNPSKYYPLSGGQFEPAKGGQLKPVGAGQLKPDFAGMATSTQKILPTLSIALTLNNL